MSARTKHTETHWAIADWWDNGRPFFYYGTHATRQDAIDAFVQNRTESWKQLYRQGKRAVKVTVTGEVPHD